MDAFETVSGATSKSAEAKQKAPSLKKLMKRAEALSHQLPVSETSSELDDAIQQAIDALDEIEGDPDFEEDDEREIDHDFEHDPAELGELDQDGFANLKPWDEFQKVFGGIYRGRSHG